MVIPRRSHSSEPRVNNPSMPSSWPGLPVWNLEVNGRSTPIVHASEMASATSLR